jgi:hypothetical protein
MQSGLPCAFCDLYFIPSFFYATMGGLQEGGGSSKEQTVPYHQVQDLKR